MDVSSVLLFLAAALALNLTPGQDMMLCLATGMGRGARAAWIASLGVSAGCVVHGLAAAFGVATLVAALPAAMAAIKWIGAAYLLYLGIDSLRRPPILATGDDRPAAAGWAIFRRGFVTNLLNPKVALFFLAFLPQFVTPNGWPVWAQIALFAAWIIAQGTIVNGLIGAAGGRMAAAFSGRPIVARLIGILSGSLLIGLAARLALADLKAR